MRCMHGGSFSPPTHTHTNTTKQSINRQATAASSPSPPSPSISRPSTSLSRSASTPPTWSSPCGPTSKVGIIYTHLYNIYMLLSFSVCTLLTPYTHAHTKCIPHSHPPRVPDGHHPVRERRALGGRGAQGTLRVRSFDVNILILIHIHIHKRICYFSICITHSQTPHTHTPQKQIPQ